MKTKDQKVEYCSLLCTLNPKNPSLLKGVLQAIVD